MISILANQKLFFGLSILWIIIRRMLGYEENINSREYNINGGYLWRIKKYGD